MALRKASSFFTIWEKLIRPSSSHSMIFMASWVSPMLADSESQI